MGTKKESGNQNCAKMYMTYAKVKRGNVPNMQQPERFRTTVRGSLNLPTSCPRCYSQADCSLRTAKEKVHMKHVEMVRKEVSSVLQYQGPHFFYFSGKRAKHFQARI